MKRSYSVGIVICVLLAVFALPAVAFAWQVTGGGGTQTQNPYGYWYAGKEACAQEGCHRSIAAVPTPHSGMVTDVQENPSALLPGIGSGLWPFTSPFGGITIRPRDIYLQLGDGQGFLEYAGPAGSSLATKVVPADDLAVWSPMEFLLGPSEWVPATTPLSNSVYGQSCADCHNVGLTRPSNAKYTLPSGAVQTTNTPTTVSELGIQCESCHGSGKNPGGHRGVVPDVVGGYQILKSQVCGQCHVTATTPQKNVGGSAFSNPNGYTTDATLSAYLTPTTVVETEGAFMNYINHVTNTKPKFLPNGDNYSMRHVYYNEWLVNLVPSAYGGNHGHADPVNEAVKAQAASGETRCFKCHSGLGFLNRIDAKSPSGTRIVPTFPTMSVVATEDPGVSCQVCHTGHVTMVPGGGYSSTRHWGNGKEVSCGDCHNWQFEMLGQTVQRETIGGVEYTRPPANARSLHAQREMVTGGQGGEDGLGGLWGVAPTGTEMPGITCKDCHMPRTSKEGMPADDDGTNEATRMSHRFHITLPGDAARWKLRPNGDSCAAGCHKGEAADYTRADFQAWIDQKRSAITTASGTATTTLDAVAAGFGLADWNSFMEAQPSTGTAGSLPAARWAMLQHAAQNVDFVAGDGSGGIHNPTYALAGLAKANLWADSATATLSATLGAGPAVGDGMTVTGSLLGFNDQPILGATVVLETSTDGGSSWSVVCTCQPNASGNFSADTGRIVGSRSFRVRFSPSAGVDYLSALMPVAVPVTTASVIPAGAATNWFNITSAQVTMTAVPGGSLTFYTLSGATAQARTIYLGPITIVHEGETDVHFWSTNADGSEATQTVRVLMDRGNPSVYSDVRSSYAEKADVHVWAMDSGAGISGFQYTFRGVTKSVSGSSFTFSTAVLGKNTLTVKAFDRAGKSVTKSVVVWVRTAPRIAMKPAGTKRVGNNADVLFAATVKTPAGAALGAQPVLLQRYNGRSWVTYRSLTTNAAGAVASAVHFGADATTYWRFAVAANARCLAGSSAYTTVVVR